MGNKEGACGTSCCCPHHKMFPIFIVLFGLLFLMNAMGGISAETTQIVWPILVILIGLKKLFSGMCKCC